MVRFTRVPRPLSFFTAHAIFPVLPNLHRGFRLVVDENKDRAKALSLFLVDLNGIEPSTSRMRTERSPS